MKLAVNYSSPLIRLIKEKRIEVDLIKCPDWEGMLPEAHPYGKITIHFNLDVGLGSTFKVDFDRLKWFKEQTATPHFNTHLVTPRNFDVKSSEEKRKIGLLWRQEINLMIENCGAANVALEHFPYTKATPHIQYAADAEIFSGVIQDTGCMFLLDLAHARITADTLNIDVKDYIESLPLERLVEMHITGVQIHNGVLTDHFGLDQKDWEVLDWALKNIKDGKWRKPKIVAFEYGGVGEVFAWRTNIDILQTQVPLLYRMVHEK
jgi:hypothetical protein